MKANGRPHAACTLQASADVEVESNTAELNADRTMLLQMLFIEGNHFCPACEKSGNCLLQATAYKLNMQQAHFAEFYPRRPVDACHPELLIDSIAASCASCACVRVTTSTGSTSSRFGGHGIESICIVNAESGSSATPPSRSTTRRWSVCPVGAILPKRRGFRRPHRGAPV